MIKPKVNVSFSKYISTLKELFIHMFTQKRTLGCDDSRTRWVEHLILVFGYLGLLFTTVFLDWFGTTNNFIVVLGYIESIAVFVITIIFIIGRINKKREINKFSLPSDWLFVIWLFLMGFTAFIVRLFIDIGFLYTMSWIYFLHLIILAQWALIIVPFGKWTHFLYRSFAIYFEKLLVKVS